MHLEAQRVRSTHAKHCSTRRESELVREKGGERGIKYGVVGIEYMIEITRVREKYVYCRESR